MEKEQEWFDKLTKKRENLAKQLKDPAAAGFWNSVVDKYSDEAHFLYELIQNADDAHATEAHISLQKESMTFTHNGTIGFSITDPDKGNDKNGIGHLNAITSIGASNKDKVNTIGKFGIGFKSVFRHTERPHIEDDRFSFEIKDFIVPVKAPRHPYRSSGETYFFFPLKSAEQDFADISHKIKNLRHPLFFLSHLKKITWEIQGESQGEYELVIKEEEKNAYGLYRFISLRKKDKETEENLYFHQYADGCSVAISSDKEGNPFSAPTDEVVYCFFPTKERSTLPFTIHAPFLLTDNRESIKFHELWNKQQIEHIGTLMGEALIHLAKNKKLGNHLFDIIPIKKKNFFKGSEPQPFAPIYTAIVQTLKSAPLFITDSGEYTDAAHTLYSDDNNFRTIFHNHETLFSAQGDTLHWCFKNIPDGENGTKEEIINFIKENHLIASNATIDDALKAISSYFIESQEVEWLKIFYGYLAKEKRDVKEYPIFLCADKKARSLASEKIYLTAGEEHTFTAILPELAQDENCKKSLIRLGLKEPGLQTEVENNIIPLYQNGMATGFSKEEHLRHLRLIFDCHQSLPFGEERQQFINLLQSVPFLPVNDSQGNRHLKSVKECVLQRENLFDYWEGNPYVYFLNNQTIIDAIVPEQRDKFYGFLSELEIVSGLDIQDCKRTAGSPQANKLDLHPISLRQYDNGAQEIIDKEISGWDFFIRNITPKRSSALFKLLSEEIQRTTSYIFAQSLCGTYSYVEKGKQGRTTQRIIQTTARKELLEEAWLYDADGKLCSPKEIGETNRLSQQYDIANNDIYFFLGIKISDDLKSLTREQKESIDIVNKFKAHGFSIKEMEDILKEKITERANRQAGTTH